MQKALQDNVLKLFTLAYLNTTNYLFLLNLTKTRKTIRMLSKVIIAKSAIILTHQVKMKEWQTEDYSQRINYCYHNLSTAQFSSLFHLFSHFCYPRWQPCFTVQILDDFFLNFTRKGYKHSRYFSLQENSYFVLMNHS